MKRLYHSNVRFVFIPLLMIITVIVMGGISGSAFVAPAFEPVTMILLGVGLLGLARFRRKVRRG